MAQPTTGPSKIATKTPELANVCVHGSASEHSCTGVLSPQYTENTAVCASRRRAPVAVPAGSVQTEPPAGTDSCRSRSVGTGSRHAYGQLEVAGAASSAANSSQSDKRVSIALFFVLFLVCCFV